MTLAGLFPGGSFCRPAALEEIEAVEGELGVRFPEQLRALYFECDGFREPKGDAQYLFPLVELVSGTRFLWSGLGDPTAFPSLPDFTPFVFFGGDGLGGWWGVRQTPPHGVIYWHHDLLDEGPICESRGEDIIDVMRAAFAFYEAENHDIA